MNGFLSFSVILTIILVVAVVEGVPAIKGDLGPLIPVNQSDQLEQPYVVKILTLIKEQVDQLNNNRGHTIELANGITKQKRLDDSGMVYNVHFTAGTSTRMGDVVSTDCEAIVYFLYNGKEPTVIMPPCIVNID